MEKFIGQELAGLIAHLDRSKLRELRFRVGQPLQMEYGGEVLDVTNAIGKKITIEKSDIKRIVLNFADGSFFSKEEQIRNGFLVKDGARLGICGECDYKTGEITSISAITSLALRLPFVGEIVPCEYAKRIGEECVSTLVISPYGVGKTTFLKKIMVAIPNNKKVYLCDDRGEFASFAKRLSNADCMQNAGKNKAFEIAIRLFSPDVLVIDEMFYSLDASLLEKARMAGVSVFASFHGRNIADYQNSDLYKEGVFSRYVVLSNREGKGTVECVYDENFNDIIGDKQWGH